jgi:Tfp pilus assembly protein PilF
MQLFRQTRLVEAQAALRESVKIDDEYPHAWFYLGEIGRYMGDSQAARDAYDRCLELNPDHGRALVARERIEK